MEAQELAEMDEEQRAEFVEIRERELRVMEKKLTEKQHELDAHVSANEKMQVTSSLLNSSRSFIITSSLLNYPCENCYTEK